MMSHNSDVGETTFQQLIEPVVKLNTSQYRGTYFNADFLNSHAKFRVIKRGIQQ